MTLLTNTHGQTHTSCSPQVGSQTGHLARQLTALLVHAPHAVDKRREHTGSGVHVAKAHDTSSSHSSHSSHERQTI